jgi:hypothetical protein
MRITDLPERIGEGEDQYDLRPEVLKDLDRIKYPNGSSTLPPPPAV